MWISRDGQFGDANLVLKHECHEPLTILSTRRWQHQQPERTSHWINNCHMYLTAQTKKYVSISCVLCSVLNCVNVVLTEIHVKNRLTSEADFRMLD